MNKENETKGRLKTNKDINNTLKMNLYSKERKRERGGERDRR